MRLVKVGIASINTTVGAFSRNVDRALGLARKMAAEDVTVALFQEQLIGGYPAERPTNPGEVVATIFHSLGLDLEAHLPGPAGRPFPLVDFGTKPIMELF